jgi:hypothetical protein
MTSFSHCPLTIPHRLHLMKLRLQLLTRTLPESLLDEQTRLTTLAAHEALRFNPTLAIRSHDNLNRLAQATPPT